jgi:hypothetical protein
MADTPATATGIILVAGTMTFANEWYNTGKADFKVAVATMFAAAIFDGLQKVDSKAAIGLSVIVLITAFTTKFGGQSVASTIAHIFSQSTQKQHPQAKQRKAA